MSDELASWLRSLPGWESADIEPLANARGRAWRLAAGNRAAVLKLDVEARRPPYNTRAEEANAQERAARASLAAPVLWRSTEGLLSAWLEGSALGSSDLSERVTLEAVAGSLKALHGLAPTGRRYDLVTWADHYREILEREQRFGPDHERAWRTLVEISLPGPLVFSHNDLVPRNIVAAGDAVRFIDWEYAGDNSPLFDLATLIVEGGLDQPMRDSLTAAYFRDCVVPDADIDTAITAYEALVSLWEASAPQCASPGVS